MGTKQTIPEWRAVADEVWALVRESQKKIDAQREENDRAFQELREKHREVAEQIKATDVQIKETAKQIGDLGHRFGDMVESMVVPNLVKKFRNLGFEF
ncbi:MAG: hypothetical protein LBT00_05775, partial [Spirochaetaceae bacterium]|nr:hypothetical protein [Spirochaetaceae bacterium]